MFSVRVTTWLAPYLVIAAFICFLRWFSSSQSDVLDWSCGWLLFLESFLFFKRPKCCPFVIFFKRSLLSFHFISGFLSFSSLHLLPLQSLSFIFRSWLFLLSLFFRWFLALCFSLSSLLFWVIFQSSFLLVFFFLLFVQKKIFLGKKC